VDDRPEAKPRVFQEAEFRVMLAREVLRSSRYQDFLSVCLMRADYPSAPVPKIQFALARQVAEALRLADIVGLVGDDIGIVLVHTPDSEAALIVSRLRERIQACSVTVAEPIQVTLAVGLASFPTDATNDVALLASAHIRLQAGPSARDAPARGEAGGL
jgi:hypothetical protein